MHHCAAKNATSPSCAAMMASRGASTPSYQCPTRWYTALSAPVSKVKVIIVIGMMRADDHAVLSLSASDQRVTYVIVRLYMHHSSLSGMFVKICDMSCCWRYKFCLDFVMIRDFVNNL